ncbi:hypothetical protein L3Q82_016713, partial [Scortum barcoo]
MSFLRRVAGRSLRDRVRSSVTREELGVEPLLLRIERSQLRWLGHLFRMPPGRLPREVFQACPTGRRPRGRPRTRWRDYVSRLAWERLGIPPEELEEVSGKYPLTPYDGIAARPTGDRQPPGTDGRKVLTLETGERERGAAIKESSVTGAERRGRERERERSERERERERDCRLTRFTDHELAATSSHCDASA